MTKPPRKQPGQAKGRRSICGELMDIAATAAFLGVTEKTLRARVNRGLVPFKRWGSRVCFLRSELVSFLSALPGCEVSEALQNDEQRRKD
jgi:hypothetical protein